MDKQTLCTFFDHTCLKPDAKEGDILLLCREALENKFAAVCVNPYYVRLSKSLLSDTEVKVCTVIGFPLGSNSTKVKVFETGQAIEDGADEIDMVINISALKSGKLEKVEEDIKAVRQACGDKAILKVIIETCLLTEDEKVKACSISKACGAHFVKTSTGFSTGGATFEDISLMRSIVGNDMGVKASGGIRDLETSLKMIEAGATRLGSSSSVKIINQL